MKPCWKCGELPTRMITNTGHNYYHALICNNQDCTNVTMATGETAYRAEKLWDSVWEEWNELRDIEG
jgi:hypothetical protein